MNLKLAIVNGPNLNWLGKRERKIYGYQSWDNIWKDLENWGQTQNVRLDYFQSNSEGILIDTLQNIETQVDGILFNPAAYAHTSIALRDCVASLKIPVVEVHLSKIHKREAFRVHSFIADVAQASIVGFGAEGYKMGLNLLSYCISAKCKTQSEKP